MRTPKVIVQRMGQKKRDFTIVMIKDGEPNTYGPKGSLRNVSASCVCASERAQRRRYEAVLETVPRTNSMVSIIWWMKTAPKVSWWAPVSSYFNV